MATFVFKGYYGEDFLVEGGGSTVSVGSRLMVDPVWDVDTSSRTFSFTDDDSHLSGDSDPYADESGNDPNQYVTVTGPDGAVITSGKVYIESAATLAGPDGSSIELYVLEVNGVIVGEITSAPLQPGVTYEVTAVTNTSTGPTYNSLFSANYDPDDPNYIRGGVYADSLQGGALNDTISAGAGADTIDGGDGNDVIYYGTGGSDPSKGDLVHGGSGSDVIDDASGVEYDFNDTLYGDAGDDTIWAGGGDDHVDGGADNDLIFGESGNDTLLGGAGDDTIRGAAGTIPSSAKAGRIRFTGMRATTPSRVAMVPTRSGAMAATTCFRVGRMTTGSSSRTAGASMSCWVARPSPTARISICSISAPSPRAASPRSTGERERKRNGGRRKGRLLGDRRDHRQRPFRSYRCIRERCGCLSGRWRRR